MPRCPDCNKFVSVEQADPEADNLSFDFGQIEGQIRLVLLCGECGTEVAEAYVNVEEPVDLEHSTALNPCTGEVELTECEAESTDRFEGKGRSAKHFYGANCQATLECDKCGLKETVDFHVEEQASFFEMLG